VSVFEDIDLELHFAIASVKKDNGELVFHFCWVCPNEHGIPFQKILLIDFWAINH